MSTNIVDFCDDQSRQSSFLCPVCGSSNNKSCVLTAKNTQPTFDANSTLYLYRCDACRSLVYHPYPNIDYTQHTSAELSIRDYVEFNAAIDLISKNILKVIPDDGRPGRLLDIGCGFGFGLDSVRSMLDWQVKGFEPSRYGEQGREQLGLDIINDFATPNLNQEQLFDIVHCSEVVEHVHDPHEFITILKSYLTEDGVLILTTPDADRINSRTNPSSLLALLSPGAHTIIFSAEALMEALKKAGLHHVQVDTSAPSMLMYASRSPLKFQRRSADHLAMLVHRYLQEALGKARPGSSLEIGLRYRLFRSAMDSGDYALAERAFAPILAVADPSLGDIATLDDFATRWPLCIAASTYYRGMLLLIHTGDYVGAASFFRSAFRLCRKKIELSPATAVVEADLIWRAVYHEALALKYLGNNLRSLALLASFVDFQHTLQPPVPEDLQQAVTALRDDLGAEFQML
ncbi:class I SAM-dependent methyltransferase (plasmid) [Aminobacter sp. SR38]|uniref:class I SAM-dependent methyltransferase n=1 Tax=Aminobacter sp. SR38 TaxID=2774562 RepID=UPI00177E09A3|nr:methyltransferase domain-containing protein [Aminobacter sp. SR38]QOF74583.1 class I SAM-dependent methyltransferase [Aminobacter sp. SR38]